VDQLVETRWTRYGQDRVYVKTSDGVGIGHVDLKAGTITATDETFTTALEACRQRWMIDQQPPEPAEPSNEVPLPSPSQPLAPPSPPEAEPRDLASNTAGAEAQARRDEINAQAPVLNFVARVLGVKTEERSWRVGARGEEKVAKELSKLAASWKVLHSVEVGDRGSDIDHIVIGPAGVFTLNTKRHPRGKAWVADRALLVNGNRTDYLRNSRHEAKRASRLLTSSCGFDVAAQPVIVFVDLDDFTVKSRPADVHVTTRRRLIRWLSSLPTALDQATADAIYAQARLSTTWTVPDTPDRLP
jgi:hypothetical protein